ncbi:unnamed protein product, partial [Prorocentrum cordatum]
EIGLLSNQLGGFKGKLKGARGDVAAVLNPGKLRRLALVFGMMPGVAMDLRTGWDFAQVAGRRRAREDVDFDRAASMARSTICGPFSQLVKIDKRFLHFNMELRTLRLKAVRYVLRGRPRGAPSWNAASALRVRALDGVGAVKEHGRLFGQVAKRANGLTGLATGPAGWMTGLNAAFSIDAAGVAEAEAAECYHGIAGAKLDAEAAMKGRQEEMDYMENPGVFEWAPASKCYEVMGKKPLPSGWVDTRLGQARDQLQEDSRCELRRGWSLKMATHGPRDAAAVFDVTVERIMQDCGAMQGEFCPCVYGKCALMSWRHGDDVVVLGDHREFKDFAQCRHRESRDLNAEGQKLAEKKGQCIE